MMLPLLYEQEVSEQRTWFDFLYWTLLCVVNNFFVLYRNNVWATCPSGYFLNGLRKSDGQNLYNIEEGQCCRPVNEPGDGYDGCYDEDVTTSFDNVGWSDCQRTGYYMTGIYKSSCEEIYCIEKFKCCRMKTSNYIVLVGNSSRRRFFPSLFNSRPNFLFQQFVSIRSDKKIFKNLFRYRIATE